MKKAIVLQPFTTDNNEICLNGDVIYLEEDKVFFERRFLGRHYIEAKDLGEYFKIEESWK